MSIINQKMFVKNHNFTLLLKIRNASFDLESQSKLIFFVLLIANKKLHEEIFIYFLAVCWLQDNAWMGLFDFSFLNFLSFLVTSNSLAFTFLHFNSIPDCFKYFYYLPLLFISKDPFFSFLFHFFFAKSFIIFTHQFHFI
jgi:hypothetical protein